MLPVFRRFSQADIPAAPDWMGQVFNPLNVFCETTVQTLNKNLTFGQNIQGQKFTTSFTTGATYSSGDFPVITWQYTGGGRPDCLLVGQIMTADSSLILTPVSVTSWFLNINVNPFNIVVSYIAGLQNSKRYTVTLLAV